MPASFVKPPGPSSSARSGNSGASRDVKSGGKSYKGNAPTVVTMATANILTYLNAIVSMNSNSDLLPCVISIPCLCQAATREGSAGVNKVVNVQGVHTVSFYALLGQGSLAGDFVSQQALDSLDIQLQTSRMSGNPNLILLLLMGLCLFVVVLMVNVLVTHLDL